MAGLIWQLLPSPGVTVRKLDDELLLFDSLTWRTHLLNATAAELVRLIGESPSSVEDLVEALAPENADFRQEVEGLLRALADLGLVERVDR